MGEETSAWDLYLDESGTFRETSSEPAERARAEGRRRRFPSQLAGLLVPAGALTRKTARRALAASYRAADLPVPEEAHGTNHPPGPEFDRLVTALVAELARRGWRPVRLVNREAVSYGDRVANYTNLVAELALRPVSYTHLTLPTIYPV